MDALSQAKSLIERSQNIMILPSPEMLGDSLGSALALFLTLKKLGKNVNILIEKIPEKFQFLTSFQLSQKDLVIAINTSEKEISEMHYEKNEKDLKIYLTLNKGRIEEKDISFLSSSQSSFNQNPDLLIVLGASSLESLGELFYQNSYLFDRAPILNIDNQLANENFGEVNLVDITVSLAEILTNLIKLIESEEQILLDEEICTCLLTGVIWSSQNFRSPRTRPKTLETSAYLIERGADHQRIVQHLYRQKNVSQIKLLGKILEKISFDEKKELYLASLTEKDFQDCQASSKDLGFIIEELKFNFRYLPNLLILWESHASPTLIKGIFCSPNSDLIKKILENFEGISRREGALFLIREDNLNSAKEKILRIL